MKRSWYEQLLDGELAVMALLRWLVVGGLTGLVCGLAGGAFSYVLAWVTQTREAYPWLLFFMPIAGLLIVWSYQTLDMANDSGTNQIIASVRSGEKPRLRLALLIFFGGGHAGQVAAAGRAEHEPHRPVRHERPVHRPVRHSGGRHYIQHGGGQRGHPPLLRPVPRPLRQPGIPGGHPAHGPGGGGLGPVGDAGADPPVRLGTPELTPLSALQVGGLGIGCALVAILFCTAMHTTAKRYQSMFPNPYVRILVGAALVIALTCVEGSGAYNGAGSAFISAALAGEQAVPWAFLLKIAFTALTLGAGFRGGEIVPTFFIGAAFGSAVAPLLGLDPAFGAAIGLIALFCGVVNCPLASILLSVELFGGGTVFFALACALSYLLSGRFSLYSSQKIVYSKLEPRYIDASAR